MTVALGPPMVEVSTPQGAMRAHPRAPWLEPSVGSSAGREECRSGSTRRSRGISSGPADGQAMLSIMNLMSHVEPRSGTSNKK